MKTLCISVHPDDETLGCGGTLLRHQAKGDALYWLIVTQAYEPQWSAEIIECKIPLFLRFAKLISLSFHDKLCIRNLTQTTLPVV